MSPNVTIFEQHVELGAHDDDDCMMSSVDPVKQYTPISCPMAELSLIETSADSGTEGHSARREVASSDVVEPHHQSTLVKPIIRASSEIIPVCTRKQSYKVLPPLKITRSTSVSSGLSDSSDFCRVKNSVSFSSVIVREYDQTIGDHPSVSYGPPISLDWNYEEQASVELDDYECLRGKRRSASQLMMSYWVRKDKLMYKFGYSEEEMKKAHKEAERAKLQRAVTKYFLPYSQVEDAITSGVRKAKRVIRGKRVQSV